MASREAPSPASRGVSANKPLPPTFKSIQDVLNGEGVAKGTLVSVIGVVRDLRRPIPTRNSGGSNHGRGPARRADQSSLTANIDWKCVMTLCDKSIDDENTAQNGATGIELHLFCPQNAMPEVGFRDVVLIKSAKVQDYRFGTSLLSNYRTAIYVYSASAIPMPPKSAKDALKPRPGSKASHVEDDEHEYVSWMYHSMNKDSLPEADVFEEQANRSLNVRDKFSLLKDVGDGGFYDLIVEVIKDPYDLLDKATVWVTDYTENKHFYHHSWDISNAESGRDGDPYGYTTAFENPTTKGWPGPPLRSQYGRNGGNLEGYLREDRAYPSRLGFDVIQKSEFTEDADSRLKDLLKRKLEYKKKLKQQKEAFAGLENTKAVGAKRKDNGESATKPNAKQRRKIQRAQRDQEVQKEKTQKAESLGLNKQVRCESEDQPVSSFDRILNGVSWRRTRENGEEEHLALPFTNIKFRANVRVVDFRPRRLEDFAAGRKMSEYDCLEDYDGGSASGSDGQSETLDSFAGPKTWEWRFALELEDASPKAKGEKPERIWALVDNIEAQQLVNLDAVDLQANQEQLSQLREQLFKLWGNLEECKRHEYDAHLESIRRTKLHMPPPDSSDNEIEENGPEQAGRRPPDKVSNKPFTCCLQQYGLEISEADPTKCDSGEGKRYQRVFKIFGTAVR
ncbi:uncharacterized protein PG998_007690 [Apiospora kogelbergensis]|uniref:uncharacterized protein n=1 Tax=Apiospora kogelbergensis TaxID=1337665 RepID=UPI00312D61B2